jgi:hypothetical protein
MGAISSAAIAAPVDPDPLPNARFDDELRMLRTLHRRGSAERCLRGCREQGPVPSAAREMR